MIGSLKVAQLLFLDFLIQLCLIQSDRKTDLTVLFLWSPIILLRAFKQC